MKQLSEFPDAHLRIFDRPPTISGGEIRSIYLIGICGTGMGSLAGLLQQSGYLVSGSDAKVYPPMSTRLAEMGILVHEGYDSSHLITHPDLVVVGNACTPTHVEASYARDHRLPQLSLPEALAHFFIRDRRSLVVAGTHGKTTTTGMLVQVFESAGLDPGFLVGGILVKDNSSYAVGDDQYFIIEGDEYDSAYFDKQPKFMHYRPSSAIITSMEFDHADIYDDWDDYREAFRTFAGSVSKHGILALYSEDPEVRALANFTESKVRYYGLTSADVTAQDIRPVAGGQRFTLVVRGNALRGVFLPMSGRHNLRNALGVATVALHEGLSAEDVASGLADFKGIKRRQEIRGEVGGVIVIDDFAHHPTAVAETIRSVRERWPGRRIFAIFEPRSNSSRRKVFEEAYVNALNSADLVFLSTPPLRHNDRADDFLNVSTLVNEIESGGVPAASFSHADELLPALMDELAEGDVALVMSNGSFGGIHDKILNALRQRTTAATDQLN